MSEQETKQETQEERNVRFAKEMNERVTELKGNLPNLSDAELSTLSEEILVSSQFFKSVMDLIAVEKMKRDVKAGLENADLIDAKDKEDEKEKEAISDTIPKSKHD